MEEKKMVVEKKKNKGGREEEGLKRKEKRKGWGRLKSKGRARGNEKNPTSRFGLV